MFAVTLVGISANSLIGPVVPDIISSLGAGEGAAGLIVASASLPGIIFAPTIGVMADRWGRRRVLVPCLVLFGTAGALSAAAPSVGVLVAARVAQGAGGAGLINLAIVIISDHTTGLERARWIGRNAAVLTVGLLVLPPVGGALAEVGGWRLALTPYAAGVVVAAVAWRWMPPDADRHRSDGPLLSQLVDALRCLRQPALRRIVVVGVVLFMLLFGLQLTALPLLLEDRFGAGPGLRGLLLAVTAVASTLVSVNLARLRARFGPGTLVAAGLVAFAAAFVVIGTAGTLVAVVGAMLVVGVGEGLTIPTLQDAAAEEAPEHQRGAVLSLWVGGVRAGQSAGPLAVAATAAADPSVDYLAGAVIALGAAVAARSLGRARGRATVAG